MLESIYLLLCSVVICWSSRGMLAQWSQDASHPSTLLYFGLSGIAIGSVVFASAVVSLG